MHHYIRALRRKASSQKNQIFKVSGTLLLEVIVVAIGVWAGLWVDKNREDRIERQEERDKLMEIRSNLIGDLADLRENYFGHQRAVESSEVLIDQLKKDQPYQDSLLSHYGQLEILTFFNTRSGAYEALKNTGVELITNKGLRNKLVKLYDYNYEQIFKADQNQEERYDRITTFFQENFRRDTSNFSIAPIDYEAMKSDPAYFELLLQRQQECMNYRNIYQSYAFQVNNLVDQINTELYGQDEEPDTVRVKMTLRAHQDAKEVLLHGSFLPWDKEYLSMELDPDLNFWVADVLLYPGVEYFYWFMVDGQYTQDPGNDRYEFDGYRGYVSLLEVDEKKASLVY
jgi:hypothetical protein